MPTFTRTLLFAAIVTAGSAQVAVGADPFHDVADQVNKRLVKLFGAGGFQRLNGYGSGIVVSPEGHILTVASQLLDTSELIVHMPDGLRMRATVLVVEPELDAALVQLKVEGQKPGQPNGLQLRDYFDVAEAARRPVAQPGDWVLGFGNAFEIAMRDESMTVQKGVVAAYSKLSGRKGVFDFPYTGDVYVVDAITNNPGGAGGALTDRKGNLLGVIGREIRNTTTDTWMNYAIPVGAKVEVLDKDKKVTLSLTEFVEKGMKGQYKPIQREDKKLAGPGGFHGVVFVPNVLERTPAYVDGVLPDSPAAKAGLRPDDLVSFADGEPIVSIKAFNEFVRRNRPGTTIRLEVRRGEALQSVELTLGELPPKPAPVPAPPK